MVAKFTTAKPKQEFFEGLLDWHLQAAITIGLVVVITKRYCSELHYFSKLEHLKYVESAKGFHCYHHHWLSSCSN